MLVLEKGWWSWKRRCRWNIHIFFYAMPGAEAFFPVPARHPCSSNWVTLCSFHLKLILYSSYVDSLPHFPHHQRPHHCFLLIISKPPLPLHTQLLPPLSTSSRSDKLLLCSSLRFTLIIASTNSFIPSLTVNLSNVVLFACSGDHESSNIRLNGKWSFMS